MGYSDDRVENIPIYLHIYNLKSNIRVENLQFYLI